RPAYARCARACGASVAGAQAARVPRRAVRRTASGSRLAADAGLPRRRRTGVLWARSLLSCALTAEHLDVGQVAVQVPERDGVGHPLGGSEVVVLDELGKCAGPLDVLVRLPVLHRAVRLAGVDLLGHSVAPIRSVSHGKRESSLTVVLTGAPRGVHPDGGRL